MDLSRLVAAVRTLAPLGQRLLGTGWPLFLEHFGRQATALCPAGVGRTGEFLLLDLPATGSSVAALRGAIEEAKDAAGWTEFTGPAPLQVLFCSPQEDPATKKAWQFLPPGELHLSEEVRKAWRKLAGARELGAVTLGRELLGTVALQWDSASRDASLLPFAAGPLLGGMEECFCCGRTDHAPSACPSKLLPPSLHGLSVLAEHPLEELGALHLQSLKEYEALLARAASGLVPADLRQSPSLAMFVGFFDVTRLYQLRFLIQLAFSFEPRWPGIHAPGREASSRSNLYLALDCLRVGRRAEAVALLTDKAKMGSANQFYAGVGMAFAALEEGGPKGMIPELTRAAKLATTKEEHLYRLLLLSRTFETLGELDEAERHAHDAATFVPGSAESRYRCAQLAVRAGFGERALNAVRELAEDDDDYFHCALLDPQLLPVRRPLEQALRSAYDSAGQSAEQALTGAFAECDALADWFDSEDPELEANRATLSRFREQVEGRGYGQLRSVGSRAAGVLVACRSLKEKRIRHAFEELAAQVRRWRRFEEVWRAYPYKRFARRYFEAVKEAQAELGRSDQLLRRGELTSYREIRELLEGVEGRLASLAPLADDLRWIGRAVGFGKRFLRRLLLLESILVPSCLLALLGLDWAAAKAWLGPLSEAVSHSSLQRSALVVLCWVVAPLLALFTPERTG